LKWSFHEGEATGRAMVTGREEDEAAWLGWAAHAEEGGAVVTSREGGGGTTFGLPEEEDSRVADRVGPPGSDRGREGGCWAGLEAVGREEGGRLSGGGPRRGRGEADRKGEEERWAAAGPKGELS
jgi:hypothetical protein